MYQAALYLRTINHYAFFNRFFNLLIDFFVFYIKFYITQIIESDIRLCNSFGFWYDILINFVTHPFWLTF